MLYVVCVVCVWLYVHIGSLVCTKVPLSKYPCMYDNSIWKCCSIELWSCTRFYGMILDTVLDAISFLLRYRNNVGLLDPDIVRKQWKNIKKTYFLCLILCTYTRQPSWCLVINLKNKINLLTEMLMWFWLIQQYYCTKIVQFSYLYNGWQAKIYCVVICA